jgi:hypothetical protein
MANDSIVSPTHKRTEGRSPVWGSEFTPNATLYMGGFKKKSAWCVTGIVQLSPRPDPNFWRKHEQTLKNVLLRRRRGVLKFNIFVDQTLKMFME